MSGSMMNTGRQFPYQAVRIGNQGTKFFTVLHCYKCGSEKAHEAFKALPDEVIAKRFSQWGWVLGRNRNWDVCPTCVGVKPENKLAAKFKVTTDQGPVLSPVEIVQEVQEAREKVEKVVTESLSRSKYEKQLLEILKENNTILKENQMLLKDWLVKMVLKKKAPTRKVRASKKKATDDQPAPMS
jgi:hypothetical protein